MRECSQDTQTPLSRFGHDNLGTLPRCASPLREVPVLSFQPSKRETWLRRLRTVNPCLLAGLVKAYSVLCTLCFYSFEIALAVMNRKWLELDPGAIQDIQWRRCKHMQTLPIPSALNANSLRKRSVPIPLGALASWPELR